MFIGREKELAQLEKAYSEDGFKLMLVFGARNTGKTTLLEEFCRNRSAIYFTASNKSGRANLNDFSSKVLNYLGDKNHSPFSFWDDAMSYIAQTYKGLRVVVVIEGFDLLADNNAAFLDVLSRVIDSELSYSSMMIVISCDDASFLKNSPLIKKLNGAIKLEKFLTAENIERLKREEMKRTVIGGAKFVKIPADTIILREGEKNDDMYKIISGRAICNINNGMDDEYMIGSLSEGKTFGEYSILTDNPGIYTVTSYSDMLLLRISRSDFEDFIQMNAANSVNIMRNMAAMLNTMRVNINMLNDELHTQE